MNAPKSALIEAPLASEHRLPLMAGKSVLGIELRRLREAGGITRADLGRQAHVPYTHLGGLERGAFLPTKSMRAKVEALDRLVFANGKLTALWLESAPAQESLAAKIYRLPEESWPTRLRDQWKCLVAYRLVHDSSPLA